MSRKKQNLDFYCIVWHIQDMREEILKLKKDLNAVILAHNYQVPEIQDISDFVGDSLGLSQQAAKTKADVIVFCGVHFMAETAKILNPDKIVILPDKNAGCSLEQSCPAPALKKLQNQLKLTYPDLVTVTYINCSAEVKALSDIICTSGNAVKIVNSVPINQHILFMPDENLGNWVIEQTRRPMTLWKGNCYVHNDYTHKNVMALQLKYRAATTIVHPESPNEVRLLADIVCSTEKMITFCKESKCKQFIVVTESGIIHRLKKECPDKEFICTPEFDVMRMPTDRCKCSECKYMKMNTMEKLRDCMKNLNPQINLSQEILQAARIPIERMLDLS